MLIDRVLADLDDGRPEEWTGKGGDCRPHCVYERIGKRGPRTRHVTAEYLFFKRTISDTGCWLWTGAQGRKGYGKVRSGGRDVAVHRLAAELWKVPGTGPVILHACDTPLCFNPEHLSRGTQRENMADAVRKGRMRDAARKRSTDPRIRAKKISQRELSDVQVKEIKGRLDARWETLREIAIAYGVSYSTIQRIYQGKTYAEIAP